VRDLDGVLAGLNDSQREAALAPRGPIAILAGAGTGKTTTITHRIACQVQSGSFEASQILAVTFTEKAAGELKRRLRALGVDGVEARTFHSAALSQLSRLWSTHTGEPLPDVLDHKAPPIASLANALPPPQKFLPRRELAGEIEWAKNRMVPPDRYLMASSSQRRNFGYRLAGWNNSTTLSDGSSSRICLPPGPSTTSLRNLAPTSRNRATSVSMSSTMKWMRFHPPGSGFVLSGIGRPAELVGPASSRRRLPRRTSANAGDALVRSSKPSSSV
jgi:UvrD-like helicase family protein